jgi:hypothetical protein
MKVLNVSDAKMDALRRKLEHFSREPLVGRYKQRELPCGKRRNTHLFVLETSKLMQIPIAA